MIDRISRFFLKTIIKEHLIDEKDAALQKYGFQIMLANLFNFCIVVIIGLVSGELLKALVFYTVFISLRIYSGGFHASSYGCCFLLFGTICAACIFFSNWFLKNNYISQPFVISYAINGLCVYIMAPIPHVNRRISNEEKVFFRKKSCIVLFVWVMVGTILLSTEFRYIVPIITVTSLAVSILMVVASCFICFERGEENEEDIP